MYINDFSFPDMLYGVILGSTIPRGTIQEILLPELPSQIKVLTAKEIPGLREFTVREQKIPLLAYSEIRYEGEPILLLYGPDEYECRNFAEKIVIRYESDYIIETLEQPGEHQIAARRVINYGDPDTVFSGSFQEIEGTYTIHPKDISTGDAQGALVLPRSDSKLQVISSTLWPAHVRNTVALTLGIPKKDVSVESSAILSPSWKKLWFPSHLAALASLITFHTNRPAKIILSPRDEQTFGPGRSKVIIHHRTALDKEGGAIAYDVDIRIDGGAYPAFGKELLDRTCAAALGAYRGENVLISGKLIRTTTPPKEAGNGMGLAETLFALETQVTRIAELCQQSPVQWKKQNFQKKGDVLPTGGFLRERPPVEELIDMVSAVSDFSRKHASYELLRKRRPSLRYERKLLKGIGLSICYQGNGFLGKRDNELPVTMQARLDTEGKLSLTTPLVVSKTAAGWKNLAGSILEIDPSTIELYSGETTGIPEAGPSILSRNITIGSSLVEKCCEAIRQRRFRDPLPLEIKRTFRIPRNTHWREEDFTGNPFLSRSWAATVVEVFMDPILLDVKVRGVWMIVEAGKILDRNWAVETLEEGIYFALQSCGAKEWIPFANPMIQFADSSQNKTKGLGDLPFIGVPSAYVCAVSQAAGYYFDSIPITPALMHRYMEEL
ncbi:MAG: xanthine dehydrogenase family protein molybdopterin-binding subunit [Spirochaetales bacterium]|nr:xanthine dehydrogenase family protein molybdopterin-binding subunit [Spirochaetales bacterium]